MNQTIITTGLLSYVQQSPLFKNNIAINMALFQQISKHREAVFGMDRIMSILLYLNTFASVEYSV